MSDTEASSLTKLIVITGGPGAGKTAVLEMVKKLLDQNAIILPEAASIIFGGGFWRLPSISAKAAAQRAIFHVQTEMENLVCDEKKWTMGLCDRGTLDGLAYWPNGDKSFWEISNTTMEKELSKYYAVIHLRSPSDLFGYNHINPLRIESAAQSLMIDEKIAKIWKNHPRYVEVASNESFLTKAQSAIDIISKYYKECSNC
ncbi:MAG: ATP-binding protein [Bacteriovorax sp.]|nr:ATP-binding protein [Bacteriovorax sp.]